MRLKRVDCWIIKLLRGSQVLSFIRSLSNVSSDVIPVCQYCGLLIPTAPPSTVYTVTILPAIPGIGFRENGYKFVQQENGSVPACFEHW